MKFHNQSKITELKPNEVIVIGTNTHGFHGAGSAGYAFKGDSKNDWRTNPLCIKAIDAFRKSGNIYQEELKGKWAVWGQPDGFMQGKEGKSYGIVTTERPGYKGWVTLRDIEHSVIGLTKFAKNHPELVFLCVPFGLSREFGGFSWFTLDEMKNLFKKVEKEHGFPDNILIHERFRSN